MKKALIYIGAFVVSFMVVYSVYYYTNAPSHPGGLVGNADTMAALAMPHMAEIEPQPHQALVYSAAPEHFLRPRQAPSVPDQFTVQWLGTYSLQRHDSLNAEAARRFPKHPPVSMRTAEKGKPLAWGYLFNNMLLPDYAVSTTYEANGKPYLGWQVQLPQFGDTSRPQVQVYRTAEGKWFAEFDYIYNVRMVAMQAGPASAAALAAEAEAARNGERAVYQNDSALALLFPFIDFYLARSYKDLLPGGVPMESHVKLRIGGRSKEPPAQPKENAVRFNTFLIYDGSSSQPYLVVGAWGNTLLRPERLFSKNQ